MNVTPLIVAGLVLGTLFWLVLLLASILFPPKRGSAMRITEKALILVSGLLLVGWSVLLLTFTTRGVA
jgi:hypothetical protein